MLLCLLYMRTVIFLSIMGMNLFIYEGLMKGLSECSLYFNQNFTSTPFNISIYNPNTVFGIRMGITIFNNLSFQIYHHNVFYDNNLNGNIDHNKTIGLGIKTKF